MAGSIKTEPVTKEYEAGWAAVDWGQDIYAMEEPVAHMHEDSEDIEAAVAGETEATEDAGVERVVARVESYYGCPCCGWHLQYSSDRCGNATCRRSRRG